MFTLEQIGSRALKSAAPGARAAKPRAFQAQTQGMRRRMLGGSVPERRPNRFFFK